MSTTIDDFMGTATQEQKDLLSSLCNLAEQEHKLVEIYNAKIKPHQEAAKNANEIQDGQYAQVIREDANDLAILSTVEERKKLEKIRDQMRTQLKQAVEIDMGNLGIVQRQYEHYMGEPIPV